MLNQRVLRLGEDLFQSILVEIFERGDYRQAADEFRNQTEAQQILGLDMAENFAGAALVRPLDLGAEADRRALDRKSVV